MQLATNILLLAGAVVFSVVAFAAGDASIAGAAALIRRAAPTLPGQLVRPGNLSVSFLVGYGICGVVGVALGLLHLFYSWSLLLGGVGVLMLSRHRVRHLGLAARNLLRQRRDHRDALWILGFAIVAVELGAMSIDALAPPVATDELAYHLPEARILVVTHHLPLNLGGHWFYGNIPKLLEVLFAEGIALGNYSLAHVLNASIFIAFVCTAYSIVKGLFGSRAAILSAVLIATLPEATSNAQTMYIDTATTSFECGALLLTLSWAVGRRSTDLAAAALLSGLALSGKYSSAPTILFAAALLAIMIVTAGDRRRVGRATATAVAVAVAVCGYWYVKNAVRFGNPLYPLYFGHRGVSGEEYKSLVGAIQQFGPRTLRTFAQVPERFASPIEVPAFLTFAVAPFVVLVKRHRFVAISFGVYFVLYVAYWFFVASHQTRFLLAGLFVGSIAAAVVVCSGSKLARSASIFTAVLLVLFALHPRSTLTAGKFSSDVRAKLGVGNIRYAFGLKSRDSFLTDAFGCQYAVVRYLPRHHVRSGVVDNWTQWFGYNLTLYMQNAFDALPSDASRVGFAQTAQRLRRHNVRYLFVQASNKALFAATTDPIIRRWRRDRLPAENYLLRDARLVLRVDDCSLYRLASPR